MPQTEDRGYLDLYSSNTEQDEAAYYNTNPETVSKNSYTKPGSKPQNEDYVIPNGKPKQSVPYQAKDNEERKREPPSAPRRKPNQIN